jgi:hypothetical protein
MLMSSFVFRKSKSSVLQETGATRLSSILENHKRLTGPFT